jgi:hypothetical protein
VREASGTVGPSIISVGINAMKTTQKKTYSIVIA